MTLAEIIATRGLSHGDHSHQNGPCCAVEAQALARGMLITDDPREIGVLDVRLINDSRAWRDDAHRTEHLGPVVLAIDGWGEWPIERQVRFARLLADGTIERVLPIASRDAAWVADAAARAATAWEVAAKAKAKAKAEAEEWAVAAADEVAAMVAEAAARAAMAAAQEVAAVVIETACAVWLRAAEESK